MAWIAASDHRWLLLCGIDMGRFHNRGGGEVMAVSRYRLIENLMDMVNQHCQIEHTPRIIVDDMALSANEYAIQVLEELGLAKKVPEQGRCWYLLWDKLEEMRPPKPQTRMGQGFSETVG